MYCLYCLQYKSKRVHVPKNAHFSDYLLRTSVVIHVYKARARRNGYRMFFSVDILCKCNSSFDATRLINLLPNLNGLSVWLQTLANQGNGLL